MGAEQGIRAVVLLSGGLDSATALAWAREQGWHCHALTVAYGQRHEAELAAAARVASCAMRAKAAMNSGRQSGYPE